MYLKWAYVKQSYGSLPLNSLSSGDGLRSSTLPRGTGSEEDVATGRLDALADEVLGDLRQGRSTEG